MKHLALRARCLHTPGPYTAPGLGDRIHSAILGWVYGPPVTLHLTADKWRGGKYDNKPQSWAEICGLFPRGSLAVQPHACAPSSERDWLQYLSRKGIDAELYSYGDYPGKYETAAGFDIAPSLKRIPPLPIKERVELPARFFTVQWDSNSKARGIEPALRAKILRQYPGTPVVVGGEAESNDLRWSLKHIAYAMSKATFHVGVDSAFFHLAQLYMPWERIHLYSTTESLSHHAKRARDNGAQFNLHL